MQTKPRSAFLQVYSVIALGLDQCCLHALWYAGTPQGQTYWALKQMKRTMANFLQNSSEAEQNLGLIVFYFDLPNSRKEVWSLQLSMRNSEKWFIQHDLKADLSSHGSAWLFTRYSIHDWRNICMDVWITQLYLARYKATECQLRKLGWSPKRSVCIFGWPASWIDWRTQIWGKSNRSLQLNLDATFRSIGLSNARSRKIPRGLNPVVTGLSNLTAGCWDDEPTGWTTSDAEWENQITAWTNFT